MALGPSRAEAPGSGEPGDAEADGLERAPLVRESRLGNLGSRDGVALASTPVSVCGGYAQPLPGPPRASVRGTGRAAARRAAPAASRAAARVARRARAPAAGNTPPPRTSSRARPHGPAGQGEGPQGRGTPPLARLESFRLLSRLQVGSCVLIWLADVEGAALSHQLGTKCI